MIGAKECPLPRLLVSVSEAATMLDVCPRTVWSMIEDGRLSRVRIGRLVKVPIADLVAFIDGQEKTAEPG